MTIPTLKELNDLTYAEASILLLRVLQTSDLTFMYHLFSA